MSDITERLSVAIADRYKIEGHLGQGGMATVYLAQDLKHDRKVALKVLRPELAAVIGAERFLQEIKVTANLQHPNILALYDSGEADSFLYYVMPFVEGDTLRDKLEREKQLAIEAAMDITRGVAAALDYAHRQGVIHRDIKPENILIHDGQPLVADFGIALAISAAGGSRLTETGLSIGTPHYMSPEQAMGDRELDARSDIYSLGAMLYEMLAGDPPYTGSTAQAIVAKVITEKAPPVTIIRDTVPGHVAAAISKALAKLPADRFASAAAFADAMARPSLLDMERASVAVRAVMSPEERRERRRTRTIWGLATALAATAVVAVVAITRTPELPVVRMMMGLPEEQRLVYGGINLTPPRVAITPNGGTIVYSGLGPTAAALPGGGQAFPGAQFALGVASQLWIRPLDELNARPIAGTEKAWAPAISADGRLLAFTVFDESRADIRVAPLAGGPPLTVATSDAFTSASWGPDDQIYFIGASGLRVLRVAASGGPVDTVTTVPAFPAGGRLLWPSVLPNGQRAVVTVGLQAQSRLTTHQVHVIDFAAGRSTPVADGVYGLYSPSGHLLFITPENVLMAAPFDAGRGEMTGPPTALVEGVDYRNNGASDVTISASGSMVYSTSGLNAPERIVWVTMDGTVGPIDPTWTGDLEFEGLSLSPDGSRLALEMVTIGTAARTASAAARGEIWIKQLPQGPLSRLTFEELDNRTPTWSPDGRSVVYLSRGEQGWSVMRRPADGSGVAERLPTPEREMHEVVWSPDGQWLLGSVSGPPSDDVVAYGVGSADTSWALVVDGPADEYEPALSPSGRWLAYVSEESGQAEIYIRPFPSTGTGKWQISTGGGIEPVWGATDRTLYYRSFDATTVWRASMPNGPSAAERSIALQIAQGAYEANPRNRLIALTPDGRRVIMINQTGQGDVSGDLVFVQNILADLRQKSER